MTLRSLAEKRSIIQQLRRQAALKPPLMFPHCHTLEFTAAAREESKPASGAELRKHQACRQFWSAAARSIMAPKSEDESPAQKKF